MTRCHVTPRHVTSRHVISCHVMSCHVTSRHVTSRHVTSRHVTSRHVTSRHVTSCHVMSCHVVLFHMKYCITDRRYSWLSFRSSCCPDRSGAMFPVNDCNGRRSGRRTVRSRRCTEAEGPDSRQLNNNIQQHSTIKQQYIRVF